MSGVAHTGTSTLRGAVNVTWSTAACAGSFESETARRWPVPGWKISTTGLLPDQSARPTSSVSSGDRSGVSSVGPFSLLFHGPGDHGTECTVGGRLLMSLSVLLNVAALESASARIATVAGSTSVALAVNCTAALMIVASLGSPTLTKRSPTKSGPMCRSLPPRRTLAPSCSASSVFAAIATVLVTGAASQRHPQV
jgi:hypothetical protein